MYSIRFSSLLVLLVVSACSIGTDPSRGELDNVGLSWQDGLGCLFGCDANGTIALGAAARFGVEDHEREPDLSVASPDGSALVTYDAGTGTVVVTALEAGEVVVEFLRDGGVYDRFRWPAAPIADLELRQALVLPVGASGVHGMTVRSAGGTTLRGRGALESSVDPAFSEIFDGGVNPTPDLGSAIADAFTGSNHEQVWFQAHAPGEGTIVVDADGGARFEIPVVVVADADIDAIELDVDVFDSDGAREARVVAAARSAGRELVEAPCTWSFSDGAPVGSALDRSASASLRGTGTHEVTCTIGTTTATARVAL